jgi:hypothetical protein
MRSESTDGHRLHLYAEGNVDQLNCVPTTKSCSLQKSKSEKAGLRDDDATHATNMAPTVGTAAAQDGLFIPVNPTQRPLL